MNLELWEVLVPASNNKDLRFVYEHHKEWDAYVKKLTGGVTIMKVAKGEWVSPTGKLYVDRMIPCRIVCTEEQISDIIDFTIEHYKQEAVLAYRISTNVILRHKTEPYRPEPYRPYKMVCVDKVNDIWENGYCKIGIDPKTCVRQASCTDCPNLIENPK
jgi:hypothetical protein